MKIKKYFTSLAEMAKDVHPVNVVMGRDGLYEVRVTPVGIFSKKVSFPFEELDRIREGFILTLPHKIPSGLLAQIVSFFRKWGEKRLEAQAQIFWDIKEQRYFVYIPKQKVGEVSVDIERNLELEKRHTLVLELHSHHYMTAVFSPTDNDWEKATGLYGVIGNMGEDIPSASFRYSCGGDFRSINLTEIFQNFCSDIFKQTTVYPEEWDRQITIPKDGGNNKNGDKRWNFNNRI